MADTEGKTDGQLDFDWMPARAAKQNARPTATSTRLSGSGGGGVRASHAPTLRLVVEGMLRSRHIPYVDVDQAKKALFSSAKLRAFHFVVYRKDSRNWLLYCSQLKRQVRDDLIQWEQVFGEGFVAVVAKRRNDGDIVFAQLNGASVSL